MVSSVTKDKNFSFCFCFFFICQLNILDYQQPNDWPLAPFLLAAAHPDVWSLLTDSSPQRRRVLGHLRALHLSSSPQYRPLDI